MRSNLDSVINIKRYTLSFFIFLCFSFSFEGQALAQSPPVEFAIHSSSADGGRVFVSSFSEGRALFFHNGLSGYIDTAGNEVIPAQFVYAFDFQDGLALVSKSYYGQWGFIDGYGNEVIPLIYQRAFEFVEGLAAVQKNDKWGFIDRNGNEVVPFIYQRVFDFADGLATVVDAYDRWGFVDQDGNVAIALIYQRVFDFAEGRAEVQRDGLWGFIDRAGNEVIPPIYYYVFGFRDGLTTVSKGDNQWGVIDRDGNVVIPLIYQMVFAFNEGIAVVQNNDQYGAIDMLGRIVVPIENDWMSGFRGGASAVIGSLDVAGTSGFIDRNGMVVRSPSRFSRDVVGIDLPENDRATWSSAVRGYFNDGFALVSVRIWERDPAYGEGYLHRMAFMNRQGEIVFVTEINPVHTTINNDFIDGLLHLRVGDNIALFNLQGESVIYLGHFSWVDELSEGLINVVDIYGRAGFIDTSGNVVVPFEFNHTHPFREGMALVLADGVHGFIENPLKNLIRVNINGRYIVFEQNPIIEAGRTLVPMRTIFEELGAYISWDGDNQTITATRGRDTIIMSIGEPIMIRNGQEISLDVAPTIVSGRTLVPVRAIAEALDADVSWDGENSTVVIRR